MKETAPTPKKSSRDRKKTRIEKETLDFLTNYSLADENDLIRQICQYRQ